MTPEQKDIHTTCTNLDTEELIERLDSKNLTDTAEEIYENELKNRGIERKKDKSTSQDHKSYTESSNQRYFLVFLSIIMLLMALSIIMFMKNIPLGATSILTATGLFILIKYSKTDHNIILTVYPDYLEYSPAPGEISSIFFKDIIEFNEKITFAEIKNGPAKKAAIFTIYDASGKPIKEHIAAIERLSKTDQQEVFASIKRYLDAQK